MRMLFLGSLLVAMTGCGVMISVEDRPPTIPSTDAGIAQALQQEQAKAKLDAATRQQTPD